MRTSVLISLVAAFLVTGSIGAPAQQTPTPDDSQLTEHGHYVNSNGQTIHSPAHSKDGSIPAGATARCSDGSYSFSQHRRGTCSHHGGVDSWLGQGYSSNSNRALRRKIKNDLRSPLSHIILNEYAAHHREVYHNHDNCPAGKQIKPYHKESGTAGRPLCKDCAKLGEPTTFLIANENGWNGIGSVAKRYSEVVARIWLGTRSLSATRLTCLGKAPLVFALSWINRSVRPSSGSFWWFTEFLHDDERAVPSVIKSFGTTPYILHV